MFLPARERIQAKLWILNAVKQATTLRSSKSAGCISQFLKILVYVHGSSLFSLPQGFTCAVCSPCAQAVLVSCPLGLAFIAVMTEDLLC